MLQCNKKLRRFSKRKTAQNHCFKTTSSISIARLSASRPIHFPQLSQSFPGVISHLSHSPQSVQILVSSSIHLFNSIIPFKKISILYTTDTIFSSEKLNKSFTYRNIKHLTADDVAILYAVGCCYLIHKVAGIFPWNFIPESYFPKCIARLDGNGNNFHLIICGFLLRKCGMCK